uniref:Carbonic anhydrase n=1 Tax=Amphimedon queenslandica TaxID=400682 RepID=A6QR75_AMPQE|nr:TPA_inf: carbonic anhydrase 1 [Amphimedon queenslandica]
MQGIIALLVAILFCYNTAGACSYAAGDKGKTCKDYHFGYSNQDDWKNKCPDCGHNLQSPINILSSLAANTDESVAPLKMCGWCDVRSGTLKNNGHTLKFTPSQYGSDAYLSSRNHNSFKFLQFHFHWGPKNTKVGSEHTVDGGAYNGEMHFVFSGTDECGSQKYTVVGVFLKTDRSAKNVPVKWQKLNRQVAYNSEEQVQDVKLYDYLPENKDYYLYAGSLTTPPCTEAVQWIVMKNPIVVPEIFFDTLRSLKKEDGKPLTRNHRGTQPLNGRDLYSCYKGC